MILEYHRPTNIENALKLLSRQEVWTIPIGGGSTCFTKKDQDFAVVDLQSLGLNRHSLSGKYLHIGASTTLQSLLDIPSLQPHLRNAIKNEATYNQRQIGTLAGTLIRSNGRSPLTAVMLALDVKLTQMPDNVQVRLGDFLPTRAIPNRGILFTEIILPASIKIAYRYIARSRADLPIVCTAIAKWPSGRTRVVLGGHGSSPLAVFDGPDQSGAVTAAQYGYKEAGDQWAGADYRSEMAGILTRRCLGDVAQ